MPAVLGTTSSCDMTDFEASVGWCMHEGLCCYCHIVAMAKIQRIVENQAVTRGENKLSHAQYTLERNPKISTDSESPIQMTTRGG